MENEKRLYVTRFRDWWRMSKGYQGVIGGIMGAACWPNFEGYCIPTYLTSRDNQMTWLYKCECTPEQYARFTEIISGYFDTSSIDFDYKEE